jgi:hypothetical protein
MVRMGVPWYLSEIQEQEAAPISSLAFQLHIREARLYIKTACGD